MRDASWTEACLRECEAAATLPEHIFSWYTTVVEAELAVTTFTLVAHDRDFPHEFVARRVRLDDEHARPAVRCRIRIGNREHDCERRPVSVGNEPLVAVDDPRVAILHGASTD